MKDFDTIESVTETVCRLLGIAPPENSASAPPENLVCRLREMLGGEARRILLYCPDAIGRKFLEAHSELENAIIEDAPLKTELRSMFPPITPVCYSSMFTGAAPEFHGNTGRDKSVLVCDTLFDALLRSGFHPAIVAVKGSTIERIFRGREMDYFAEEYDPEVTERTLALVEIGAHDVVVLYHQEYDDTLHEERPDSARAILAAGRHIAAFRKLVKAARLHWIGDSFAYAFLPDHGAHVDPATGRGTHGADIPDDMEVLHFWGAEPGI
ncbi:MAG: hypothetical protein HRF49_10995 [bacterium]|jgi:hypothetical protein